MAFARTANPVKSEKLGSAKTKTLTRKRWNPIHLDRSTARRDDTTGFLIVEAVLATEGILEYSIEELDPRYLGHGLGDKVKELVTADVLEKTIPGLHSLTLTLRHPDEGEINSRNFQEETRGVIIDPEFKARTEDSKAKQVGSVVIKDEKAIRAYQSKGFDRFSLGYFAEFDIRNGEHSEFGEFDTVQTDRNYHHASLVRSGRAEGTGEVGNRLDSDLNQKPKSGAIPMTFRDEEKPAHLDQDEKQVQQLVDGQSVLNEKLDEMTEQLTGLAESVGALVEEMQSGTEGQSAESGEGESTESGEGESSGTNEDSMDKKAPHLDEEQFKQLYNERQEIERKAAHLDVDLGSDFDHVPAMKKVIAAAKDEDTASHLDSETEVRTAFEMVDVDDGGEPKSHLDSTTAEKAGAALRGGKNAGDTGGGNDEFLSDPNAKALDTLNQ